MKKNKITVIVIVIIASILVVAGLLFAKNRHAVFPIGPKIIERKEFNVTDEMRNRIFEVNRERRKHYPGVVNPSR